MAPKSLCPPFGSLNHLAIEVGDLNSALHFYQDILGLSALPMPEGLVERGIFWLDLGKGLALHVVQEEGASPGKIAHFAFEVEDVQKWRKYFTSMGIAVFEPQVDVYTAQRIFVKDPSGNRLEFVKWL